MKLTWKGRWYGGEIDIEADTLNQLVEILEKLSEVSDIEEEVKTDQKVVNHENLEYPQISVELGCSDAIRELSRSDWGKKTPRTLAEITNALAANAIYYPQGTLSGSLTKLTQKKDLRRTKKNGKWAYVGTK